MLLTVSTVKADFTSFSICVVTLFFTNEPFWCTRRNGLTSDVFGKVTPVESIDMYLLLQNSRQTYPADYHDHAMQIDAPRSHREFQQCDDGVTNSD